MKWFLLIIIICILLWAYFHFFKIPKFNNLALISGGVKSGKSTMAVYFAIKTYKKVLRRWKIRNFIRVKLFRKQSEEKPLLYSNIPIYKEYTPITEDLLLRNSRFRYGSVIYLGELSLVSNSMNYKDEEKNERQLLFYKLIAHSTKGGYCIVDTQSITDLHYSVKRSLSNYFYIHHTVKIPLVPFLICYVRECIYAEDGVNQNNFNEDLEHTLKRVLVPKKVWKWFDCYCYSVMTDDLPVEQKNLLVKSYKAKDIVSFNKFKSLYKSKNEVNKNA